MVAPQSFQSTWGRPGGKKGLWGPGSAPKGRQDRVARPRRWGSRAVLVRRGVGQG